MKLLSKIPSSQEILPVFSLILFVVFSWTIYRMLFQIPSWLYSHTKSGIFFLAAYVFSFALLESILLLLGILIVCLILPRWLFRDRFVPQSSLVIILLSIWALVVQFQRESLAKLELPQLIVGVSLFILSLLVVAFISYLVLRRFEKVESAINRGVDRMTVFAWLYAPIGIISIIIVAVRNIG